MALNKIPQTKLGVISKSFKDLSFNFTRNPVTHDVNVLKNEEAIKQSVKNLILTKYNERLFNPYIGSNATAHLFGLSSSVDIVIIIDEVKYILTTFESRIRLENVEIILDPDSNEYTLQISYYIIGDPIIQTIDVVLIREM